MGLFLRVTAVVAIGIVALVVLGFVLKIVFFAAIVAALVIGGLALFNVFRRRRADRMMTITQARPRRW